MMTPKSGPLNSREGRKPMDEPRFSLWERYPVLRTFHFFDIESTGLHEGSYPVQFAWSGLGMQVSDTLVRPAPEWLDTPYDESAEALHGITKERAIAEGRPVDDVARMLNDAFGGGMTVSDSPRWDAYWTKRLFEATGVAQSFRVISLDEFVERTGSAFDNWCVAKYHHLLDRVNVLYRHTHKADDDARRLTAICRMMLDRPWAEWLLDMPLPALRR
jgi:DNA polymerase III alpha subunit (gram-positive type)